MSKNYEKARRIVSHCVDTFSCEKVEELLDRIDELEGKAMLSPPQEPSPVKVLNDDLVRLPSFIKHVKRLQRSIAKLSQMKSANETVITEREIWLRTVIAVTTAGNQNRLHAYTIANDVIEHFNKRFKNN